jgi:UDP-N-acetylmuramoyl-L-alanyl-D-glutamate--2,6-diaminopimelate ligase
MLRDGTQSVVMEVSSHGIDQHRIDSMRFEIAVFTNLSPEHLDYHGTMEQYFYTKARLFVPTLTNLAVIGTDTEWGQRLASQVSIDHVTYGPGPENDFVVSNIELVPTGTRFSLQHEGRVDRMTVPILGAHNAYNAAAAAAVGFLLGLDRDEIYAGIEGCHAVAGRFESIAMGQDFQVVVDYAHTPDAIRSLIETVRLQSTKGRVILVAGARGRRDRLKRPELGRAAATSDLAILTADNPGDEEPAEIVALLLAGTVDVATSRIVVELDRRRAIGLAVEEARPGDTVLIVGRGHEQSLRVGSAVIYLDDREVARSAIAARLDR